MYVFFNPFKWQVWLLIGAFIILVTIVMFGVMKQKINFLKCLLYVYGIQLYQGEKLFQNIKKRKVKCFHDQKNYSSEVYVFHLPKACRTEQKLLVKCN